MKTPKELVLCFADKMEAGTSEAGRVCLSCMYKVTCEKIGDALDVIPKVALKKVNYTISDDAS